MPLSTNYELSSCQTTTFHYIYYLTIYNYSFAPNIPSVTGQRRNASPKKFVTGVITLTLAKIKYRRVENRSFRSVVYHQVTYIAVRCCKLRGPRVVCWDLRQSYFAGFPGTGPWSCMFLYLNPVTIGES